MFRDKKRIIMRFKKVDIPIKNILEHVYAFLTCKFLSFSSACFCTIKVIDEKYTKPNINLTHSMLYFSYILHLLSGRNWAIMISIVFNIFAHRISNDVEYNVSN